MYLGEAPHQAEEKGLPRVGAFFSDRRRMLICVNIFRAAQILGTLRVFAFGKRREAPGEGCPSLSVPGSALGGIQTQRGQGDVISSTAADRREAAHRTPKPMPPKGVGHTLR
jgi:hypothetical protein